MTNSVKDFPELNLGRLKKHFSNRVKEFPFISTITLFKPRQKFKNNAKYIALIEFDLESIEKYLRDPREYAMLPGRSQKFFKKFIELIRIATIEKFSRDPREYAMLPGRSQKFFKKFITQKKSPDKITYGMPSLFLNERFRDEIYIKYPDYDFRSEWDFILLIKDDDWPEYISKESAFVLFSQSLNLNGNNGEISFSKSEPVPSKDKPSALSQKSVELDQSSIDAWLTKLIVTSESDEEISIREPRKPKKIFKYDHAGFKSSSTAEWEDLIKLLASPPHTYILGKYRGAELEYNRRRSRLKRINEKLISLINNFSKAKIPNDYNLYERCKAEEPGTYKFKFKIEHPYRESEDLDYFRKKYEKKSKEKLKSHLVNMQKECRNNPEANYLEKKIEAVIKVLMEKHGVTQDEISDLYLGKTDEDFISEELSVRK